MRTPRNYDGTANPAKKMGDLIPEIVAKIAAKAALPSEAIFHYWQSILGEKWAPFTEFVSLKDQVLTIKVKSATLYALLSQHERGKLLKQLQEKFPIRNLVFRVG